MDHTSFEDEFGSFGYGPGFHYHFYIARHDRDSIDLHFGVLFVWKDRNNDSGHTGKLMLFHTKEEQILASGTVDDLPLKVMVHKFSLHRPLVWDGKNLFKKPVAPTGMLSRLPAAKREKCVQELGKFRKTGAPKASATCFKIGHKQKGRGRTVYHVIRQGKTRRWAKLNPDHTRKKHPHRRG